MTKGKVIMPAMKWLATLGLALLLPAAHATTAVVFSESTGRWGVTWNEPDKKEAIEVATDRCRKLGGGKDCKPVKVTDERGFGAVANTCAGNYCGISVITGRRSAAQAERDAIKDCNSYYGTKNCYVLDNWEEIGTHPVVKAPPPAPAPQPKPATRPSEATPTSISSSPAPVAKAPPSTPALQPKPAPYSNSAVLAIAIGHHRWGDDGLPVIDKGEQASVFYCSYGFNQSVSKLEATNCAENKCKKAFPGENKCKTEVVSYKRNEYDANSCEYIMAWVGPPGDNGQIAYKSLCSKNQRDAYIQASKAGFPVEKGKKVIELINAPNSASSLVTIMDSFGGDLEGWAYNLIDVIKAENGDALHQAYLYVYYHELANHPMFNDKKLLIDDRKYGPNSLVELSVDWLVKAAQNGNAGALYALGFGGYINLGFPDPKIRRHYEDYFDRKLGDLGGADFSKKALGKAAAQGHKKAQDECRQRKQRGTPCL